MSIQFVKVDIANSHVLANVDGEIFDHDVDPALLTDYLKDPNHFMCVARLDDLVIGQARAMIHRHPDQARELYIDNVGVAPSHQRKGIATRLIEDLIHIGKEHGCHEIWLGTEPDNEPAKALYRSLSMTMEAMVMFHQKLT